MAMKKEALTNLIADDLAKRNENWTEIDNTFELKADKSTTYTKTEVDTSLGLKADKQQEEWITPTLLNGWQHHSVPLQYMKDNFGFVHFRGGVKGGVAFTTICPLPLGYTPESTIAVRAFKYTSSLSSMASLPCGVATLPTTGLYSWLNANGASEYLLFDGVHFKAVN